MKPLNTVEEGGFKEMLRMFDSRYTLPSRKTFSSVLIPQLYEKVRAETVLPAITEASFVAMTTDMWTSRASDQYIGVTAHFIRPEWTIDRFTLENKELPPPHDNLHIAESLESVLQDWKLDKSKMSAIVTDNASNITKAVREVMALPNVPCFGHTLNLVVKAGLADRGLHNALARCSKLVEFVRRSAKAKYKLADEQEALDFPMHKLIQDVDTRWGSTHVMLTRIIEPFSGEKYVTISGLLPAIWYIEGVLEINDDDSNEIRQMKITMSKKLGNYYHDMATKDFLMMASFLDGRYKLLPFINDAAAKARVYIT